MSNAYELFTFSGDSHWLWLLMSTPNKQRFDIKPPLFTQANNLCRQLEMKSSSNMYCTFHVKYVVCWDVVYIITFSHHKRYWNLDFIHGNLSRRILPLKYSVLFKQRCSTLTRQASPLEQTSEPSFNINCYLTGIGNRIGKHIQFSLLKFELQGRHMSIKSF